MKHTIKTTSTGRSVLVNLTTTKQAAFLEIVDPRGTAMAFVMMEAEHLDALIFALTETRERIEFEREGAKRMTMNNAGAFPTIEKWAAAYVRGQDTAMLPVKPCNQYGDLKSQGVRCHDADACAGGQIACPTKTACGVQA